MKPPVILTSWKDPQLAQVAGVLQRWGCEVRFFPREENLLAALRKGGADLMIVDSPVAKRLAALMQEKKATGAPFAECPLVVLRDEQKQDEPLDCPHHSLPQPLDVARLHELLQKLLRCFPRKQLRMSVRLPGMLLRKEGCSFGDILSLGTGGAFIKTACKDMGQNEPLEVVIPLMGMKKELELQSRILYKVTPSPENNYQQGIGVAFTRPDPETFRMLQQYITHSLLENSDSDERCDHPCVTLPASASPDAACRAKESNRRITLNS